MDAGARGESQIIAEGLAAFAVGFIEMGQSPAEARLNLITQWERLGSPPGAFSDAVESMKTMPQPLSETPEQIARAAPIREMLGVASAEDQLMAGLVATQLLRDMAAEFS